jgi:REP element-mobilizing transposase RayT
LLDSWRHCQQEKGLLLYAWCIMSNHLHFIASSKNADLSGVLRDFKKFTSKEVIKAIENNSSESRRNWMLSIFRNAGETNSRNKDYQFWRQDNHPIELYSSAFTVQRINYIHQNPVRAGIVEKGEDYRYSSAKDYFQGKKCGLIDICLL